MTPVTGTTNYTNNTAADVIAAAGANVRLCPMAILVTNAHVATGSKVEIRDGTTVKFTGYAAAAGGGFTIRAVNDQTPLFVGTANTAITARAVTSGADVDVSISAIKKTVL